MIYRSSTILLAGTAFALATTDIFERQSVNCTVPGSITAVSYAKLPDPFKMQSGTAVTTKAQFDCRVQEISEAMQQYELGDYPPPPDSVKGTLSGNTLTVVVTVGTKSISFTASISKAAGQGPFRKSHSSPARLKHTHKGANGNNQPLLSPLAAPRCPSPPMSLLSISATTPSPLRTRPRPAARASSIPSSAPRTRRAP